MSKKGDFRTLGASAHSLEEREVNDFYATDPIALEKFLDESIKEAAKLIKTEGYKVTAIQEADLEWLSISEKNCLDESFVENIGLNFTQLTDKSHDLAWDNAIHYMDKIEIAKAGGANEAILKYISSKDELKSIRF